MEEGKEGDRDRECGWVHMHAHVAVGRVNCLKCHNIAPQDLHHDSITIKSGMKNKILDNSSH
jgi:hypothetical protein